jgi:hypothetical protein
MLFWIRALSKKKRSRHCCASVSYPAISRSIALADLMNPDAAAIVHLDMTAT